MGNPDKIFAAHVTGVAFHLTLSKSMIICLKDIANENGRADGLRAAGLSETTVPTRKRLEERGLIYAPNINWPGRYVLTKAGLLTVELLKVAGLIEHHVESSEKEEA